MTVLSGTMHILSLTPTPNPLNPLNSWINRVTLWSVFLFSITILPTLINSVRYCLGKVEVTSGYYTENQETKNCLQKHINSTLGQRFLYVHRG